MTYHAVLLCLLSVFAFVFCLCLCVLLPVDYHVKSMFYSVMLQGVSK